jgi:beta-lactamase superfamily II metal-dependent hydrolase
MKNVKVTIYLPDNLRRDLKKHVIDTGETLSAFIEAAARLKLDHDKSRTGKKRLRAKLEARELDSIIKDLAKS